MSLAAALLHVSPYQGEASAPPRPAPRQGPRQLLAALFALGDVCPPEWPTPGASQQIAAAADAAAAAGRPWLGKTQVVLCLSGFCEVVYLC